MDLLLILIGLVVVGIVIGYLSGLIWPERPFGLRGDLLIGVATAIVIGLIDWYVIPAMGFSPTLKWLGVAFEPALGALFVLWLVRWNARRA